MKLFLKNVHIMLIMSTILAVVIDVYNLDKREDYELDLSDKCVLVHSIGFFAYQILHFFLSMLSCITIINKALGVLNGIQTGCVLFYHHNAWISKHQEWAEGISELFRYTMMSQYYAVYIFLILSVYATLSNWFTQDSEEESSDDDALIVLGTTYKNCKWYMSWINMLGAFPPIFAVFFDLFLIVNNPSAKFLPCDKCFITAFHSFLFIGFQIARSMLISAEVQTQHDTAWAKYEMIQFIASIIYLWNPFFVNLATRYDGIIAAFPYTRMYETVAVPACLLLMLVKAYVNYKMSYLVEYRKDRLRTIRGEQSIKFHGVTFKIWYHLLFFLHVVFILAIPVTWIYDKYRIDGFFSFSEFWRTDQTNLEVRILMPLLLLLFVQILHMAISVPLIFGVFDSLLVLIIEVVLSILYLLYWFNPKFAMFQYLYAYLSIYFPNTATAMVGSVIGFFFIQVWIIVLMINTPKEGSKEAYKYEVLDGEAESSTKKEHHEHPTYWLRKLK